MRHHDGSMASLSIYGLNWLFQKKNGRYSWLQLSVELGTTHGAGTMGLY